MMGVTYPLISVRMWGIQWILRYTLHTHREIDLKSMRDVF